MVYENTRMEYGNIKADNASEGLHHLMVGNSDSMLIQPIFENNLGASISLTPIN